MSITAMKQALEALERIDLWLKARYSGIGLVGVELEAITSLRQAIATEESSATQEPLCTAAMFDEWFLAKSGLDPKTPLYTHPPQRSEDAKQPKAEQEPVAWIGEGGMKSITDIEKQAWIQAGRAELVETYNNALYTHPQPKAGETK